MEGLQDYKHMLQVSGDKRFLVVVIPQGMYCLPAYEALGVDQGFLLTYYETGKMRLQSMPFRNFMWTVTIFSVWLRWKHCSEGISNRNYFVRAPSRSAFGWEPVLLVLSNPISNMLPMKNDEINNSYYRPCSQVSCIGLRKGMLTIITSISV